MGDEVILITWLHYPDASIETNEQDGLYRRDERDKAPRDDDQHGLAPQGGVQ